MREAASTDLLSSTNLEEVEQLVCTVVVDDKASLLFVLQR